MTDVVPVFKNENKEHAENYRPVSLLCLVSRILERCVFNSIKDREHSLIDSSQDGFIGRRSCLTQFVEVLAFIGSQLHNGGQVDVIYLDISKDFDKVSHCKLLNKLRDYGFGGELLAWFESCLSVRSDAEGNGIRSELAGSRSDIRSPSGVHIGPNVVSPICELSLIRLNLAMSLPLLMTLRASSP